MLNDVERESLIIYFFKHEGLNICLQHECASKWSPGFKCSFPFWI